MAEGGRGTKRPGHGDSPPPLYTHSVVFCSPGEQGIVNPTSVCLFECLSGYTDHPPTVGPQDFELLTVLGTGGDTTTAPVFINLLLLLLLLPPPPPPLFSSSVSSYRVR